MTIANKAKAMSDKPETLSILVVTLAIGLLDHTWYEHQIELKVSPNVDPDNPTHDFNLHVEAYRSWENEGKENKYLSTTSIAFCKVIGWQWKE